MVALDFAAALGHKDLLPVTVRDAVCFAMAAVTLFVAAGTGIGGGGVLVPLYILGLQFHKESAVALSNLTIAGAAFANLICNFRRRHPVADRPLIDWDLILVMEPMTIIGAVFGGFLNKIMPTWIVTLLLLALLVVLTKKLWCKAVATFGKETSDIRAARSREASLALPENESDTSDMSEPLLVGDVPESLNKEVIDSLARFDSGNDLLSMDPLLTRAHDLLAQEAKQVPCGKLVALLALFLWVAVTDSLKAQVNCGGVRYWLLVLSVVPFVAAMMSVVQQYLLAKARLKQQVGLVPEQGDIAWTPRSILINPALCSMAGVVAGMFGIGGGIVKGPLMLALGVLPEVAAASSATMILFTSGSASVVYITFGGVKWAYASVLIVLGFLVTLLGQSFTYYLMEKSGRRSIIIVAMAVLLTAGAFIMGYESVVTVVKASKSSLYRVHSICS